MYVRVCVHVCVMYMSCVRVCMYVHVLHVCMQVFCATLEMRVRKDVSWKEVTQRRVGMYVWVCTRVWVYVAHMCMRVLDVTAQSGEKSHKGKEVGH